MNLRLFVAIAPDASSKCPANEHSAAAASDTLLPIWSDEKGQLVTKPIPTNSKKPVQHSRSFRLVNGWNGAGTLDAHAQTFIQAAEPASVGGGCWFGGQGRPIVLKGCGTDRLFQFYLGVEKTGIHTLLNVDASPVITDPATRKNLIVVSKDDVGITSPNICVYSVKTGLPVVAPDKNFHFPTSGITELMGRKIPPSTQPTAETVLPGCDVNMNADCMVARAINNFPAECTQKPSSPKCILTLTPVFCFDVPGTRIGQEKQAQDELNACIKKVPSGPCSANPSGAACASGAFPGIAQWVPGGGSSSSSGGDDSLFPKPAARAQGVDQLLTKILSGMIGRLFHPFGRRDNKISDKVTNHDIYLVFRLTLVYGARVTCYAATSRLPEPKRTLDQMREACADLFQPHAPIKELPSYEHIAEGDALSIFTLVVYTLFNTDTTIIAEAVKYVGRMDEIMDRFTDKTWGTGNNHILEATTSRGIIRIFHHNGDKHPTTFREVDLPAVKENTIEKGFANCKSCLAGPKDPAVKLPLIPLCCVMTSV